MGSTRTQPPAAPLISGEFLVMSGEVRAYGEDEADECLAETGWRKIERRPLAGPGSVIVADAASTGGQAAAALGGNRSAAPGNHLPVDAAYGGVFDFEEFRNAVFRVFEADAAFSSWRRTRRRCDLLDCRCAPRRRRTLPSGD
jgi:hypothetical protein